MSASNTYAATRRSARSLDPSPWAALAGTEGGDVLVGTDGDDQLAGLGGDDYLEGRLGNDIAQGGAGNDIVFGNDGNDNLLGDDGDDYLNGGAGADYVEGGLGNDAVEGGAGNDIAFGGDGDDNLLGGDGDDYLNGSLGRDYFEGGLGNDAVDAGAGDDIAFGGDGNDNLIGGDGDDYLNGGAGIDYFEGGLAKDVIEAGAGNDIAFGGAGNDVLLGGGGDDYLNGDADDDNLLGEDGADTLVGGDGADYLEGGAGKDVAVGGAGNDIAFGGDDDDNLLGGDGADYLNGSLGKDYFEGGFGNDTVEGGAGNDIAFGGGDNDNLIGGDGDDYLNGGDGLDYLEGGLGRDAIEGGTGNDTVIGGDDDDNLIGGDGADYLNGGAGADYADGGLGNDAIDGGAGNDILLGGDGDDNLLGGGDGDYLDGGAGLDYLEGGLGGDTLLGGAGSDSLLGGDGDDTLLGGAGDDSLTGGAGNDFLFGGEGVDTVRGEAGNDLFDTGAGGDSLLGGAGADVFLFSIAPTGITSIADFDFAEDRIRIEVGPGTFFAGLASGPIRAESIVFAPSGAQDADDYIIVQRSFGAVFYDADGNGPGAAVQIALLPPGNLMAANFEFVGSPNSAPAINSPTTASVAEDSPVGTLFYQASATDPDGDRITWSLTGADAASFEIDAVTGAVRLMQSPDFEAKSVYLFNVVASDSSVSAARAVRLDITDVTETTPVISETGAPNESTASAQVVDRGALLVAGNPNLPDDDLPSITIQGSISGDLDRDYFAITLQAGEKLILDVDGTDGGLDSFLRAFGPNGAQLLENDDQGAFDPGSVGIATTHNTDSLLSFRAATSGTYYFSIESFEQDSSGGYRINVSVAPPATQADIIEEDIQALLSGEQWPSVNGAYVITYSFPDSATDYSPGFGSDNDQGPEPASFSPFTAVQQAAVQLMLPAIANLTGLSFQQLTGVNDGDAKLRYAMTDATGAAHAYFPGNYDEAGSLWFNKTDFNAPVKGGYAWMGILHETGHALGLKHGHEPPALSADRDSLEYSVMTYRSYPGDPIQNGYSNETWGYPQTLMMYDIAALQRMYGADFGFNAGNSVYTWNQATGEMSINGVGQGAPGGNRILMTVWDGGGTDTYDLSGYSGGTTLDLRPGEWTTTSQIQIANLGQGHFARGNVANALLFEGNPASLIENAIGGGGADTIYANQAANQLTGGGGADTFRWAAPGDAGTGAAADTITDFLRGTDRIDLSGIDANPATAGNDAFSFIDGSAFHHIAGELRFQVEGNAVRVQADLDGNGLADLEILVNNQALLTASDFFL